MNVNVNLNDVGKYGADKAIILAYIKHLIRINEKINEHNHNGIFWTGHLTQKKIAEITQIPLRTVERKMRELVDDMVVYKGNFNQKSYDSTGWYAMVEQNKKDSSVEIERLEKRKEIMKNCISDGKFTEDEVCNLNVEDLSEYFTHTISNDSWRAVYSKYGKDGMKKYMKNRIGDKFTKYKEELIELFDFI